MGKYMKMFRKLSQEVLKKCFDFRDQFLINSGFIFTQFWLHFAPRTVKNEVPDPSRKYINFLLYFWMSFKPILAPLGCSQGLPTAPKIVIFSLRDVNLKA